MTIPVPAVPAVAVLATCLVATIVPARWSRAATVVVAVAALGVIVGTRALWEYDTRRALYLVSRARGVWLDRSVELTLAAAPLSAASALRGSRPGLVLSGATAFVALLCLWATR